MLNERIAEFYAFMRERESIRLKKERGDPWPWTTDPILQQYKFTNVKREHDRTSKFLIETYYKTFADEPLQTIIFNAAVYRYFGTAEFAMAAGWWSLPSERSVDEIECVATYRLLAGERVFTGAYMVTNANRTGPKQTVVCQLMLKPLLYALPRIEEAIKREWCFEDGVKELCKVFGFSTFQSKETLLDTRYTNAWPEGTPIDKNTWTGMGPGGKKGMAYIESGEVKNISEKKSLEICLEVFNERHKYWPEGWIELELADCQFQSCEFFKYKKVQLGLGRPRSKYVRRT